VSKREGKKKKTVQASMSSTKIEKKILEGQRTGVKKKMRRGRGVGGSNVHAKEKGFAPEEGKELRKVFLTLKKTEAQAQRKGWETPKKKSQTNGPKKI